jgi:hypothetical protein
MVPKERKRRSCLGLVGGLAWSCAWFACVPASAFTAGQDQYPYSIMAPEPGTRGHNPAKASGRAGAAKPLPVTVAPHPSLLGREAFIAKIHRRGLYAVRGSSGSVLPTALPKTRLIPPEGRGGIITAPMQSDQGRTVIPGVARSVPNLPHGPETFQDRASRCAHQAGVYGVPGTLTNQYMSACAM